MIHHLDSTLANLLDRELSYLSNADIKFDTPDSEFNPTSIAVNLFLYDVRENLELRSNEVRTIRGNGTATQQQPAVRVDCSYLITAWAGDIKEEHRILGDVMHVLLRYNIPEEVLDGVLDNQELPLPTAILQPGRLQSVGEFWQALDGRPKAALNYTVTIAVRPFDPDEVPLAIEGSASLEPASGQGNRP